MNKSLVFLLLLLPIAGHAQSFDASSSSSSAGSGGDASPATEAAAPAPRTAASGGMGQSYDMVGSKAPVASVAMHANYMFQTSPYVGNRSFVGWSVVPTVYLKHGFGFQADFTSLYMRSVVVGEKRLLIAAGPKYTFAPRSHFTPFVYGEGGMMRTTTKANNVADWNPVAKGGIGFDFKGVHGIGFQLIPGEYTGEKVEWRDQWNHNFSARAGIVFNLYK